MVLSIRGHGFYEGLANLKLQDRMQKISRQDWVKGSGVQWVVRRL